MGAEINPGLWSELKGLEDAKQIIERRVILPLEEPALAHGTRSRHRAPSSSSVRLALERRRSPRASPHGSAGPLSRSSPVRWPRKEPTVPRPC